MIGLFGALAVGKMLAAPPACTVLLQFDGSRKRPTDPGFSTASLARIAACAASLTVVATTDGDNSTKEEVLSVRLLGGKSLNASSIMMASGTVEYEGLLLGLEGLQTYLKDMDEADDRAPKLCHKIIDVIVQGDCKTVIEQMSGVARPRKLQDQYNRASEIVLSLSQGRRPPFCRFQFQHIPRAENVLCDRMAAQILLDQQETAQRRVQEHLRDMTKSLLLSNHQQIRNGILCRTRDDELRSNIDISGFLLKNLGSGTSLIPYSKRPAIYQHLADMAAASNDWTSLLSIGAQLQSEVETVWTRCAIAQETTPIEAYSTSGIPPINSVRGNEWKSKPSELLMVEALVYQLSALQKLRRGKEARILTRKKRFLLSKYSASVSSIEERLALPAAANSLLSLDREFDEQNQGSSSHRPTAENKSMLDGEDWPLQVVEWYDEIRSSSNLHRKSELVFWGKWKKTSN